MTPARQISLPRTWLTVVSALLVALGLPVVAAALGAVPTAFGAPPPDSYSIWTSSTVPRVDSDPEDNAVQLGVKFTTSVDGFVTAIRYYKSAENVGEHRGTLYSSRGQVLGRVTFTDESTEGWQEAQFDSPIAVSAGNTYTAAYVAPEGHYADDVDSLSPSEPTKRYALTATQGVYTYGSWMPTLSWNDSNYYVDVTFSPANDDSAPPSPTSTTSTTSPTSTTSTTRPATSTTNPPSSTTTRPTTSTTSTTTTSTTTRPTTSTTSTTTPPSTPTAPSGAGQVRCAVLPSTCGYPDATNTGVPLGRLLVKVPEQATSGPGWKWDSRGWVSITGNGAVFDGYAVNATIDVSDADNVTISNTRIFTGGEGFGIALRHASSVTIANSEISAPLGNRLLVGIKDIYGDSAAPTIRGNDISGTSTGVQVDQGLIEDNYIHDLGYIPGDHVNGTTSNGGSQPLTIRHNTVFNQYSQTDAISLFQDFGPQANRVIDNNLVAGGGYTIYAGANPGKESSATNIQVTNNRFSRLFFPNSGSYGPYTAYTSGGGNRFAGNVWDDTLLPLG